MKCTWFLLLGALAVVVPAHAQQKTGPGIIGDDSLTNLTNATLKLAAKGSNRGANWGGEDNRSL